MIERFECKGSWKLPTADNSYNGHLTFSPEKGANLEVFGSFNTHFFDRESKQIILGTTSDGDVTLVDNWYRSTKANPSNGVTVGSYRPGYIITGHHFETPESMLFSSVKFELFNLFQWLDTTGFTSNYRNVFREYSISYQKPPNISFEYFHDCSGTIEFYSPVSIGGQHNRTEVEERCHVTLKYSEKRPLENILKDIHVFVGFVTLFTFEQSYPVNITLMRDDILEDGRVKLMKCMYRNTSYDAKYPNRHPREHLLGFKEVQNEFPTLINVWHTKYNELKPVFTLLLSSFKDKLKFNEDKFMDLARGVETFHRRTQSATRFPVDEFNTIKERILSRIDPLDKELVAEKLSYANEPTLKNRLTELMEHNSTEYLKSKIPDAKAFIRKVIDSRNYYTHYSKESEVKTQKGADLFELYQILFALLSTCLMNHVGVNGDRINDSLKRLFND